MRLGEQKILSRKILFLTLFFTLLSLNNKNYMVLSKEKIKHFQGRLEEEKKELENDLSRVGKKNPDVPGDWEVVPENLNTEMSDTGEISGAFEDMENRVAVENTLEERFNLVNIALENIKSGSYGTCSNKGEKAHPIEIKRLEANPAATECIKHAGI